jgi:hypothetical protein
MKNGLKVAWGLFFFSSIRRTERSLPLQKYYSLLKVFAEARAALNTVFKNPRPRALLPDFLNPVWTGRTALEIRRDSYLNQFVQHFQDRLAGEKWMSRCHIAGLDRLQQARRSGRPVVLAFCHFGPFFCCEHGCAPPASPPRPSSAAGRRIARS